MTKTPGRVCRISAAVLAVMLVVSAAGAPHAVSYKKIKKRYKTIRADIKGSSAKEKIVLRADDYVKGYGMATRISILVNGKKMYSKYIPVNFGGTLKAMKFKGGRRYLYYNVRGEDATTTAKILRYRKKKLRTVMDISNPAGLSESKFGRHYNVRLSKVQGNTLYLKGGYINFTVGNYNFTATMKYRNGRFQKPAYLKITELASTQNYLTTRQSFEVYEEPGSTVTSYISADVKVVPTYVVNRDGRLWFRIEADECYGMWIRGLTLTEFTRDLNTYNFKGNRYFKQIMLAG
jgi:hypothetical protein